MRQSFKASTVATVIDVPEQFSNALFFVLFFEGGVALAAPK